jgi:hypothetical protein
MVRSGRDTGRVIGGALARKCNFTLSEAIYLFLDHSMHEVHGGPSIIVIMHLLHAGNSD